jgi:hypothetical protein
MRRILFAISICLVVSGCTNATSFGPCIGVFDRGDPNLIYKLSIWNVFWGIVFIETIIVPLIVMGDETLCPIGRVNAQ